MPSLLLFMTRSERMSQYIRDRRARDPEFDAKVKEWKRKSFLNKQSPDRKRLYRDRIASGACGKCGRGPLVTKSMCATCQRVMNESNAKINQAFFDHYGRNCACPGCDVTDERFLEIDHINNDGHTQRKFGGATVWKFNTYRKAKRTGQWPTDLQILCANCNRGKMRCGGTCPHQLSEAA